MIRKLSPRNCSTLAFDASNRHTWSPIAAIIFSSIDQTGSNCGPMHNRRSRNTMVESNAVITRTIIPDARWFRNVGHARGECRRNSADAWKEAGNEITIKEHRGGQLSGDNGRTCCIHILHGIITRRNLGQRPNGNWKRTARRTARHKLRRDYESCQEIGARSE